MNITEQWPYRSSWIILYCEVNEDKIDDFTTLKSVYERVKPFIPTTKDTEPFLEIDRDEKKLESILSFHRNTLQVRLIILLPCLKLAYIKLNSILGHAPEDISTIYHPP